MERNVSTPNYNSPSLEQRGADLPPYMHLSKELQTDLISDKQLREHFVNAIIGIMKKDTIPQPNGLFLEEWDDATVATVVRSILSGVASEAEPPQQALSLLYNDPDDPAPLPQPLQGDAMERYQQQARKALQHLLLIIKQLARQSLTKEDIAELMMPARLNLAAVREEQNWLALTHDLGDIKPPQRIGGLEPN